MVDLPPTVCSILLRYLLPKWTPSAQWLKSLGPFALSMSRSFFRKTIALFVLIKIARLLRPSSIPIPLCPMDKSKVFFLPSSIPKVAFSILICISVALTAKVRLGPPVILKKVLFRRPILCPLLVKRLGHPSASLRVRHIIELLLRAPISAGPLWPLLASKS